MNVINCTPHEVTLVLPNGRETKLAPSGTIPRVGEVSRRPGPEVLGVPTWDVTYSEVTGLPDEVDGTLLIVSSMVLDHPSTRARRDLCAPLDEARIDGKVIGCRALRMRLPNLR